MKKSEMGGACSTCQGEESRIEGFSVERDHLEDRGLDGKIVLNFWSRNFTFKF